MLTRWSWNFKQLIYFYRSIFYDVTNDLTDKKNQIKPWRISIPSWFLNLQCFGFNRFWKKRKCVGCNKYIKWRRLINLYLKRNTNLYFCCLLHMGICGGRINALISKRLRRMLYLLGKNLIKRIFNMRSQRMLCLFVRAFVTKPKMSIVQK